MSSFAFGSFLLCVAAAFGLVNARLLRLPSSIGLLLMALAASLSLIALDAAVPQLGIRRWTQQALGAQHLPQTLLNGALAFLLFAGALHVDLDRLRSRQFTVLMLATAGVLIAMALFGGGVWMLFRVTSHKVPLTWCLVLGAILAPTDPVAVADLLRRVGLPPTLEAVIAGESLFNDGVGVVLFVAALGVAGGGTVGVGEVAIAFLREAAGGLALGVAAGWVGYLAMRGVDEYRVEVMISLAVATGTYSLANALGTSGPIAVVAAGLLIGHHGQRYAMSERTREHLINFWSLIDELLNALLFLLIGLELVAIAFPVDAIAVALLGIPLALAVRLVSVVAPTWLLHLRTPNRRGAIAVLTWGGLRGGLSVAMALTLPQNAFRAQLLAVCYAVVVFAIVVQGLTLERVMLRFYGRTEPAD
jgi:CPA1 family monovalent cation:H+ antiporter